MPDTGRHAVRSNSDNGELVLEIGYEWILDGSNYTGSFTLGDRFVLANFGP